MAKKSKIVNKKPLSETDYIKKFARILPVEMCEMTFSLTNPHTVRVLVVRKEPKGMYTIGFYLIDSWCRGLYDTYCRAHVSQENLDEILTINLDSRKVVPMTYDEAHNFIFGAIEYSEDAGFSVPKEFAWSQYVLAEDTDDIPMIHYEWGLDGKRVLECNTREQFKRAKNILERNLSPDEYMLIGATGEDNWQDDMVTDFDLPDPYFQDSRFSDEERRMIDVIKTTSDSFLALDQRHLALVIITVGLICPIAAECDDITLTGKFKKFFVLYDKSCEIEDEDQQTEMMKNVLFDEFINLFNYSRKEFFATVGSESGTNRVNLCTLFFTLSSSIYNQVNGLSHDRIEEILNDGEEMAEFLKRCSKYYASFSYPEDDDNENL